MNPIKYFSEVRDEVSRIVWPSKEQTIRYTVLVIVVSVFVGLFLGGLDYVLTILTAKLLGT